MSTIYTINNKIATINGNWMTKYVPPKLRIDLLPNEGEAGSVSINSVAGMIGGVQQQLTPSKVTGWSGDPYTAVQDLTNSSWQMFYSAPGAYISFEFEPFTAVPTSSDLAMLQSPWSNWNICTVKVYYNDELINTLNNVEYGYPTFNAYGPFALRG